MGVTQKRCPWQAESWPPRASASWAPSLYLRSRAQVQGRLQVELSRDWLALKWAQGDCGPSWWKPTEGRRSCAHGRRRETRAAGL